MLFKRIKVTASIEEIGRLAGFVQPPGTKNAGKVNFKRIT